VDKIGILSWPNPTAEKIWVFNSQTDQSHMGSTEKLYEEDGIKHTTKAKFNSQKSERFVNTENEPKIQTYSLTLDNSNGYELKFDDAIWTKNINNFKPIVIYFFH
jgi:hypothetical protein